jgi:hypothetical protein
MAGEVLWRNGVNILKLSKLLVEKRGAACSLGNL